MTDIAADCARLLELESELDEMRHRFAQAYPHRPRFSPPELLIDALAQGASGCALAVRQLRQLKVTGGK